MFMGYGGVIKMRYIIMSLIILLLISGCTTTMEKAEETAVPETASVPKAEATTVSYTDLSPAEAKALIDNTPDLIIIDVSPHYDAGHLPGAVHYYIGDGSLDAAIPKGCWTRT